MVELARLMALGVGEVHLLSEEMLLGTLGAMGAVDLHLPLQGYRQIMPAVVGEVEGHREVLVVQVVQVVEETPILTVQPTQVAAVAVIRHSRVLAVEREGLVWSFLSGLSHSRLQTRLLLPVHGSHLPVSARWNISWLPVGVVEEREITPTEAAQEAAQAGLEREPLSQ